MNYIQEDYREDYDDGDDDGDDYGEDYDDDYGEDYDDYGEDYDDDEDYDDGDDYGEDYDDGEDRDDYDDGEERADIDEEYEPAVTKILNHVPGNASADASKAVPVTGWSAPYTASGKVSVVAYITGWSTGVGLVTYNLLRNGLPIDSGVFFFNQPAVHMSMPPLYAVIPNETGTNVYSISVQGGPGGRFNVDINDRCLIIVTEY
jgi:hypothetical protein